MKSRKTTSQNTVISLLLETKSEIIRCLRTCSHAVSEKETKYIYFSDISGRQTKLQNIAGNFFSTSSKTIWKRHEEAVLGNYLRINAYSLMTFIVRLHQILKPIKGCPPPKKSMQNAVNNAIKKLTDIIFFLYSVNDSRSKQYIESLIHASHDFDYAKKIFCEENTNLLNYNFEMLFSFILIQARLQQHNNQKEDIDKFIFLLFGLSEKANKEGLLPHFFHALEAINQAYFLEHKKNILSLKLLAAIPDAKALNDLLNEKKKPRFTVIDKILLLQALARFQMQPRHYHLPLIAWTTKDKSLAGIILDNFMPVLKPSQAIIILFLHYENPFRMKIDEKKLLTYLETNLSLMREIYETTELFLNHPLGEKIKTIYHRFNPQDKTHPNSHAMIELTTVKSPHPFKKMPLTNSLFFYPPQANNANQPEVKSFDSLKPCGLS